MRLNSKFKLWKIRDEYVIVNNSSSDINLTEVFTLNEPSAFLWNKISGKSFDKKDLVDYLCAEYDVKREIAEKDIDNFILQMKKLNFIVD